MQALKTKLFLLKSSLTFGILKDKFESLKLGTNKLHNDTGHFNFIILSVSKTIKNRARNDQKSLKPLKIAIFTISVNFGVSQ